MPHRKNPDAMRKALSAIAALRPRLVEAFDLAEEAELASEDGWYDPQHPARFESFDVRDGAVYLYGTCHARWYGDQTAHDYWVSLAIEDLFADRWDAWKQRQRARIAKARNEAAADSAAEAAETRAERRRLYEELRAEFEKETAES